MSRRPSDQEIDRVHKYIEYCMMHHMTKTETMDCIASQASIEPVFTRTIWEQLEAENQEFFRAYYIRLAVRDQTVRFNSALSQQAQLMHQQTGQQNGNNGLPPHHSNGSRRAMRHQQNDNNGLQHRCNGSQQQALMHQHNGAVHHSNTSQQVLMHQHNGYSGLVHRSSGSQQALMHQHNVNNGSRVSTTLQVSTPNAGQLSREAMQQVFNSRTSSRPWYLQGMNE